MRLLVISDTHNNLRAAIKLLNRQHGFDALLHLGDLVKDADDLEALFDLPVYSVAGNCDWGSSGSPNHRLLTFADKKIFMTHGHTYQVKVSEDQLKHLAHKDNLDVILYGHTHSASITYEGKCIIMNPGSMSLPRDGKNSYGVITIDKQGDIHSNIVRIP